MSSTFFRFLNYYLLRETPYVCHKESASRASVITLRETARRRESGDRAGSAFWVFPNPPEHAFSVAARFLTNHCCGQLTTAPFLFPLGFSRLQLLAQKAGNDGLGRQQCFIASFAWAMKKAFQTTDPLLEAPFQIFVRIIPKNEV